MKELQEQANDFVKKYHLETSPELRYLDLVSEVGEVGKELLKGSHYGKETFSKTEDLALELGDVLFSLLCLSNCLDISLEESLKQVLQKYETRFQEKGNIGSGN